MHIEKTHGAAFCGEKIADGEPRLAAPLGHLPTDQVCGRCLTEMGKQGRAETFRQAAAKRAARDARIEATLDAAIADRRQQNLPKVH